MNTSAAAVRDGRRDEPMGFVYHLVHEKTDSYWHLRSDGDDLAAFDTRTEALAEAGGLVRAIRAAGRSAQLVVHGEDGSMETTRGYGFDPSYHVVPCRMRA